MFTRWLKYLFHIYEPGYEYWIPMSDILIPDAFTKARIENKKWKQKMEYYKKNDKLQDPIILTKDFTLIDGYPSYKIAQCCLLEKVPVRFVDWLDN